MICIYSNVWKLAFNVTVTLFQISRAWVAHCTESGSVQAAKRKIQRKKSRWIQHWRTWTKGDENVTNPPPKKKKPRVECVREPRWDRSVYYRPFSTALKHARTEMLHFHFSLGWAVTRVDQTPPFPKWDPLHFTSSIKTFQWSLVGVLSPCKKAPPMGRYPSPQKMKKNRMLQWWKIQAPSDLFNIFFSLLFSLDIILFPQRAQMQSVTNSCDPDTQRPTHTCFMVPQDVSLTPHHFQEIARTHVQIGRLMSGMSASGHA